MVTKQLFTYSLNILTVLSPIFAYVLDNRLYFVIGSYLYLRVKLYP